MDTRQIEMIVGMFAGLQAAYAETVRELEKSGLISCKAVAERLENHANSIPADVRGRTEIAVMLRQLARLLGEESGDMGGNTGGPADRLLQ